MAAGGRKSVDDALVVALAAGGTVREAAAGCGVGERTVYRRLSDPSFRRRMAELRADMVQQALGKMADGMSAAADTLRQLLCVQSDSVRLGAARAILELGNKLRETVDLEQRLQALEDRLASSAEGPYQ